MRNNFFPKLVICGVILSSSLVFGQGNGGGKTAEGKLHRAEANLHLAQVELARKAERISDLEAEVAALKGHLTQMSDHLKVLADLKAKVNSLEGQLAAERAKHSKKSTASPSKPEVKAAKVDKPKVKPVVVAKPEDKQVQKGMQKPEGQKQVVKAHKKTDGKSSADKKAVTKKPENQDLKKEGAVVVEKKEKPSIKSSFFALKSAANDDRDRILKDIQALLKEHPKTVVEIIGYANDMEWEQTNLDISRNRAEFLRSHLVFKGVPSKNLKATGKGAGDSGEKGRRVDFKLHGDN